MIKKLTKFGNSHALIIDKPILEILHINENTELEISTDGKTLIIKPKKTPATAISDNRQVQELFDKLVEEYDNALQKLAKN